MGPFNAVGHSAFTLAGLKTRIVAGSYGKNRTARYALGTQSRGKLFGKSLDSVQVTPIGIRRLFAGIYKRLNHADARIVPLSEGEVNELHVGLKGTMNALFLKDLCH